ncbi:MAG: hypothetical protein ACR2KJ_07460 [Jatrophihabitans sp.]
MLIDCETCRVRDVGCSDCVISLLLGAPSSVDLDEDERHALGVLAEGGLTPPLRLIPMRPAAATKAADGGMAATG